MPDSASEEQRSGITRRDLIQRGAAGGLALTLGGVGPELALGATPRPRRGGTLRVGIVGGAASNEQLDPHVPTVNSLDVARTKNVYSKLTDFDRRGRVMMQLAQSIEPNRNATEWTVRLKQGIVWHDGSPLTADDVIFTLRRILNPANKLSVAASNIDMIDPKGITRVNARTLRIKLNKPWADLPTQLGQRYHSNIKDGTTSFTPESVNGTGAFKLEGWTPGTRTILTENTEYFVSNKPYLSRVELIGIDEPTARLNALQSGQVQAIEYLDPSQVRVLRASSRLAPLIAPGGAWTPIYMNTQQAPFNDVRVRQAMRLLADRQKMVRVAQQGYGQVGNDLFAIHDGLYASGIPQREYDPERAKSLLKAAGKSDLQVTLNSSEATSDMLSSALVFAQSAKAGGVKVTIKKAPVDNFWSSVYGKTSFCQSSWGYRPFFAQWIQSFSTYNKDETNWKNARASALVARAAGTTNPAQRKRLAVEAQRIAWNEGGYIIWGFAQRLDAIRKNVHGIVPSAVNQLGWYGFDGAWLS
jgi:peptide/nickel transport system substrate-binding protein